jgi:predicted outer membrane repeat protein
MKKILFCISFVFAIFYCPIIQAAQTYDNVNTNISNELVYLNVNITGNNGSQATGAQVTGAEGNGTGQRGSNATGGTVKAGNGISIYGGILTIKGYSNITFNNNVSFSNIISKAGNGGIGTGGKGIGGKGGGGNGNSWTGGNGGDGANGTGGNGTGGDAGSVYGGSLFIDNHSTATFNKEVVLLKNTAIGGVGGKGTGGVGQAGAGGNGGSGFFQDGQNGNAGQGIGGNGYGGKGGSAYGGAIYLNNSSNIIFKNNVFITNNTAIGRGNAGQGVAGTGTNRNGTATNGAIGDMSLGGAIFVSKNSQIEFRGDNLSISGNTADIGGAIYASTNSKVYFKAKNVEIRKNNSINSNGVFFWDANSQIDFSNAQDIKASSNTANNGGFLYLNAKNNITFGGSMEMSANYSRNGNGGSFYLINTNLNINGANKTIKFLNHNNTNGSAIYISGANLNITGSNAQTVFDNNTASTGAIIYATNATLMFNNGKFEFSNNNSINSNGIIWLDQYSNIKFTGALSVKALNNQANIGGFLYLSLKEDLIFSGAIEMSSNTARNGSGGALYLHTTNMTVNGVNKTIKFDSNKALNGYGGAIFMSDANLIFNDRYSTVSFINNTARDGAAIYVESGNISFNSGTLEFNGNYSSNGNGIIHLNSLVTLSFNNVASIKASSNTALLGGFLHLSNRGYFNINSNIYMDSNITLQGYGGSFYISDTVLNMLGDNKKMTFKNHNDSYAYGGAIFIERDSLNMGGNKSTISFISNTAFQGAAIYAFEVTVNFSSATVEFIGNTSIDGNGIIGLEMSKVSFTNLKSLRASNNQANLGGFLYLVDHNDLIFDFDIELSNNISNHDSGSGGSLYLINSNIIFSGENTIVKHHTSLSSYSAIYWDYDSNIDFAQTNLTAIDNESAEGGFLYLNDRGHMIFRNKLDFSLNRAYIGNGGALYSNNTYLQVSGINKNHIFSRNTAYGFGGAIYLLDSTATFINSKIDFISNSAQSGGALYIANSKVYIEDANFLSNSASDLGGAIFIDKSSISITAKQNDVIFGENLADRQENDLYLSSKSFISFNAYKNKTIYLGGGIIGDEGNEIIKIGKGKLILGGSNTFKGDMKINEGILSVASNEIIIDKLYISSNSFYQGEKNEKALYKTKVGYAKIDGTVIIGLNFSNSTGDSIIASTGITSISSGEIIIGSSSYLLVDIERMFGLGYAKMTIFKGLDIKGKFNISKLNNANADYILDYYPNRVDLIVRHWSDFGSKSGLSFNQMELGKLLDNLTKDYKLVSKDMHNIISEVYFSNTEIMGNNLNRLSGAFIANTLSAAMSNKARNYINERLNRNLLIEKDSSQIWANTGIYGKQYKDYSLFKNNEYSILFSLDFLKKKEYLLGAYLLYSNNNIKQTDDKAFIQNYESGIYFMRKFMFDEHKIDLKADLGIGLQSYKLQRNNLELLDKKYNAQSFFQSKALKSSVLAEYLYNKNISIFGGLGMAMLYNPSIKENNGELINLSLDSELNVRLNGLLGVKYGWQYKKFKFGLETYMEQAFIGSESQINIYFSDSYTGKKANIKSIKENLNINLSFSAQRPISKNLNLYYSNSLSAGDGRIGYGFYLGANMNLGKSKQNISLDLEQKLIEAQELANTKQYLKATDLLFEIIDLYPEYGAALDLKMEIQSKIKFNLSNSNRTKADDVIYAKAYTNYYQNNLESALSEWYRYIQYRVDNTEVLDYYNRINDKVSKQKKADVLRKDIHRAELKANQMLKEALKKYDAQMWKQCIDDMEKLLDFTFKYVLEKPEFYRQKATHYIEICIEQLSLNLDNDQGKQSVGINEKEAEESYTNSLFLYSEGKYIEAQRALELTLRLNPKHKKAAAALLNLEKSGKLN